jgi:hypothetical protein
VDCLTPSTMPLNEQLKIEYGYMHTKVISLSNYLIDVIYLCMFVEENAQFGMSVRFASLCLVVVILP